MKKLLVLILASLFIFSGVYAADGFSDIPVDKKEKTELKIKDLKKQTDLKKADKKEYKKLIKENRKKFKKKRSFLESLSNMLLVGGILIIGGLLLYLIVAGAPWLGIAVMIVGVLLLIYGALTKFF
jgi:hypothetical protein